MPSDDELRRVAEDVRALARSLGRDLRAAVDRAREDIYPRAEGHTGPSRQSAGDELRAAGRAARRELYQAQRAVRRASWRYPQYPQYPQYPHDGGAPAPAAGLPHGDADMTPYGASPGYPPRWDNWGRRHARGPNRGRPAGRGWSGGPGWPPPPAVMASDRLPAPAPPPAPPLRHRHDGTTLLGLLALVFGVAWLLAGAHLAPVSMETVVAVALLIVGAATVVTARTDWALSRRSWPLVGGAALAVTLLALTASPGLPVGFRHLSFGSRTVVPASWAEVPAEIHGGFGKTVIDLSGLPALAGPQTLKVDSGAGRVEIYVPSDLKVHLTAQIAAGQIAVNQVVTAGVRRVDDQILNPDATTPPLTLVVRSGFGSMSIVQGRPPAPVPGVEKVPAVTSVPFPPKGAR